ncbi:rpl-11, partial [Symbiodinium microadriaticum]
VKEYELRKKNFARNGSFGFGITEHIDLGIKYDPGTGIYGMDFYVHLSRPGGRVQYRKLRRGRVGSSHRLRKEDGMKWPLGSGSEGQDPEVIKNADMAEDMQQDAIDCATQALEKYNIEKDIAAFIKKEFDKKCSQLPRKHFIYFYLGRLSSREPMEGLDSPLLEPQHGASQLALILNLINATLGCGILSLPWATAGASLVPAAMLTLVVLAANVGTNLILVYAAEKEQVFDLGGLLGRLPHAGRSARALCEAMIWITVFMCLVGYLVVIADSLQRLLPLERYLAVFAGATVVLPLCFMDQQHLAFSSTLSIAANLYVCCVLVAAFSLGWRGDPGKFEDVEDCCLLGFGRGDLAMVSVLMQAAVVQMCILPMYEQMDRRSPRRFAACLGISFGFVALLFIGFSGIAYIAIGPKVSSNVLLDLPHGPFGSFARVVMAFAVIGVYPILTSSMVAPIRHQQSGPWQSATVGIVACSAVRASEVNVISGACQAAV